MAKPSVIKGAYRRKLAVLGAHGMLGSDLAQFLSANFDVYGITRGNYVESRGMTFDVLINAAGNSRRFWANEHPLEDFEASTVSGYRSLVDFQFGTYIYISTSDVYEPHDAPHATAESVSIPAAALNIYGFHKYLTELLVRRHAPSHLILRLSSLLGRNLKKGPFHDAMAGTPLFVSLDSRFQLITTWEVANVIAFLITEGAAPGTFNVGGFGSFVLADLSSRFGISVTARADAPRQEYEANVSKLNAVFSLKSSEEYLRDYLRATHHIR